MRKLERLLEAGAAEILVLDLAAPPQKLETLLEDKRVIFQKRPFAETDLAGRRLVFAATSHRQTNALIAGLCAEQGILCNCIDNPEAGSFIVPATAGHGRITVAISTGGASPAQAKMLKEDLNVWLQERSALTNLLGRLRPLVLDLGLDSGQNSELFRKLAASELREALTEGNREKSLALLSEILPPELHAHMEDLLQEK